MPKSDNHTLNESLTTKKNPQKHKKSKKGVPLKKPLYKTLYADYFLYRDRPISEAFIKRIGEELLEYANDPDIEYLRIEPFFMSKGVASDTYEEWKEKYPLFKQYYQTAWHIIGLRREKGMLHKNLSENAILRTLHFFDPLYMAAKEEEKEIALGKQETVKIILEDPRKEEL